MADKERLNEEAAMNNNLDPATIEIALRNEAGRSDEKRDKRQIPNQGAKEAGQ